MPSVSSILKGLVALAPLVAAAPANYARQESSSAKASMASAVSSGMASAPATITESAGSATPVAAAAAAAPTLSDVDILNL
jgi:hypothetical protein